MKIKKYLVLVLLFLFSTTSCFGCSSKSKDEEIIDVYIPDGAPSIAMAKLLNDNYQGENLKVEYHIVSSDEITMNVANGNADIALLPTNAAANLYNKGVDIKIVSSNTWGMLYMVSNNDDFFSMDDLNILKGEVIGVIGKNQVPDLVFKYILNSYNIQYVESDTKVEDKVSIKYISDGPSMIPLLKNNMLEFGILAEPALTNSLTKANVSVILDLQEEWKKCNNSIDSYPQASLTVKASLLKDNNEFIKEFLNQIDLSSKWVLDNTDKLQTILSQYGSTSSITYTKEIIERCNIKLVTGEVMINAVDDFLKALHSVIPNVIGGKLPDEQFYYETE